MTGSAVLNTRPREQAAELSRLLAAAGFVSVDAPAIAIVSAWEPAALEATRADLQTGSFAWVVLASKNAARALRAELTANAGRVVCGISTAAGLGLQPAVALDRFSASAALEALRERVSQGDRVLVPRAAEGRDELIDGLRALGADVSAPIAYRTGPTDAAARRIAAGGIDVVTVCSPSAVAAVASALGSERLVCLGDTTAAAARAAGLHVHAIAASTSMAALVAAVETLPLEEAVA